MSSGVIRDFAGPFYVSVRPLLSHTVYIGIQPHGLSANKVHGGPYLQINHASKIIHILV